MYTIVIADDSKIILNGITSLIKQVFPELHIIGAYDNGNSLSECLKSVTPDILITDICMPGINGIDVCYALRKKSSKTQIILISGYKEFEYAKKAIEFNALNYLVKPYPPQKLVDIIKSAIELLDDSRKTFVLKNTNNYFNEWEKLREYVYQIYHNYKTADIGDLYVLVNTTKMQDCFVVEVEFSDTDNLEYSSLEYDSNKLSSFRIEDRTFAVLFKEKNYVDLYLRDCTKLNQALKYTVSEKLPFNDWREFCKTRKLSYAFIDALKSLDLEGFMKNYHTQLSNIDSAEFFLKTIISLLKESEAKNYDYKKSFTSPEKAIEDFYNFYVSSSYDPIVKIKQYIKSQYQNPLLSAEKISDHFNLSRSYLSKLFAEKTGRTITDYINDVRLSEAKNLLTNTKYSHEEIAKRTGYNSTSYFYRIFKKRFGITPLQYQRMKTSNEKIT